MGGYTRPLQRRARSVATASAPCVCTPSVVQGPWPLIGPCGTKITSLLLSQSPTSRDVSRSRWTIRSFLGSAPPAGCATAVAAAAPATVPATTNSRRLIESLIVDLTTDRFQIAFPVRLLLPSRTSALGLLLPRLAASSGGLCRLARFLLLRVLGVARLVELHGETARHAEVRDQA